MDTLIERLPEIITAAAQSQLGILALLSVALSVLAYFFFAKASELVRVGIFVLLFFGVLGFGAAMFRESPDAPNPSRPTAATTELSEEAMTLLDATAKDPGGLLLLEHFGDSVDLHAGSGESLFTDKFNHRALASWEAAIQELVDAGLLAPRGERGEVFEITRQGYDVAETMN